MHPNSLDLLPALAATLTAVAFAVMWARARRRAKTAERRATRATARAEVCLIAAEEFHAQLTTRERAIAAGQIEAKRRHLHVVEQAS